MAKTSTERSRDFRARKKDKGLSEIKGAYAEPDKHPEIKEYIKANYTKED